MYENFDGSSPDHTKGAENVTSRLSVEPVNRVPFADHDKCLKNKEMYSEN